MSLVIRVRIELDVDDSAGLTNLITLNREETIPPARLMQPGELAMEQMGPLTSAVAGRHINELEKQFYEQIEALTALES
jgi:hypothetical protein